MNVAVKIAFGEYGRSYVRSVDLCDIKGATEADLERTCQMALDAAAKAVRDCAVGIAAAQDLPKEVGDER